MTVNEDGYSKQQYEFIVSQISHIHYGFIVLWHFCNLPFLLLSPLKFLSVFFYLFYFIPLASAGLTEDCQLLNYLFR